MGDDHARSAHSQELYTIVPATVLFAVVAATAGASHHNAAEGVASGTEPLLVTATGLYGSLSDADATATTTFLTGGLEPPARRQRYVDDVASASGQLATLTQKTGSSPEAGDAVRTITQLLPVYTGLVRPARANNRQGFPVGAAYLRQASALIRAQILPQARLLYQSETAGLDRDYRSGTGSGPLAAVVVVAILLLALLAAQIYLTRHTRRMLNVAMLVATVVVLAVGVWVAVGLAVERHTLADARRDGSDAVQVFSAARITALRAQSDENLVLVARGKDDPDLSAADAAFAQIGGTDGRTGLLGAGRALIGPGSERDAHRLASDFATYAAIHCRIRKLEQVGNFNGQDGAVQQAVLQPSAVRTTGCPVATGNEIERVGSSEHRPHAPDRGRPGAIRARHEQRHDGHAGPLARDPARRRRDRGPRALRAPAPDKGIPMSGHPTRLRLVGVTSLLAVMAGVLVGCASSSDSAERAALAALKGPATTTTTLSPPAKPAKLCQTSLPPMNPVPSPGHMPAGSFMRTIQSRGKLVVGVDQNTLRLSYFDPRNKQLEGLEIDLLRQIAKAILGDPTKIEFRAILSTQRAGVIKDGSVDIVADAMTMSCDRLKDVAFSSRYLNPGQRVLVRSDSTATSIRDLSGKKVCASAGSTSLREIMVANPRAIPYPVPARTDCLVYLQQGKVDAISTDDTILLGFHDQDPFTRIVGPPLEAEPYGMAISKRADHQGFVRFVNGVLQQLDQSSMLSQLITFWLGPDYSQTPVAP